MIRTASYLLGGAAGIKARHNPYICFDRTTFATYLFHLQADVKIIGQCANKSSINFERRKNLS